MNRGTPTRGTRRRTKPPDAVRGRLRAHDPFELIRWLAMSRPDPRKALAELVQNSLDAGARRIRVTRIRERKVACLRIYDDGEGVIPEMDRPEALRYVATHIGHSRKRSLSPEERMALMTQGQYGIGLLGFWSLGEMLEMRSAVPGQRAHHLVLYRDRADYLIEPVHGRLPLDERWTEILVLGLHREALPILTGRRAADYLASELRGQLLAGDVDLVIEDRMSRGRAQKFVSVRPPRFLGERIEGIGPIGVPGYPPIRFEIYLCGENPEESMVRGIGIYCAGTQAAEGFHLLEPLGLDRSPWNDPRLTGMVDFPGLHVAPGSRRGIVIDEAAGAFAQALAQVEPVLSRILDSLERRRAEELDRNLIRDLQRAFRGFYRRSPRYAMLPVAKDADQAAGAADPTGASGAESAGDPIPAQGTDDHRERARNLDVPLETVELFPPGPLAGARIIPARIQIECGTMRVVRCEGLDATGRPIDQPAFATWSLQGPVGSLNAREEDGTRVALHAAAEPAEGSLTVHMQAGDREARADASVEVLEEGATHRSREGIPEPEFIDQPGASWRSRMVEGSWQVNSGHREYRIIADRPTLKLRYLAMLSAKEVVLRSHQDPRLERPLEQIVEIASYADRNLSNRGKGRRGTRNPGRTTAGGEEG